MIHVSAACNANLHTTTSHYLGADTTAFTQLMMSDLFVDFPTLRLIIPHGGGAVPVPLGSLPGHRPGHRSCRRSPRRCSATSGSTRASTTRPGIDLLLRVVPIDNILFASEMVGAVRGVDPETGHHYDDTRRYLDAADLTDAQRQPDLRDQRPARSSRASTRLIGASASVSPNPTRCRRSRRPGPAWPTARRRSAGCPRPCWRSRTAG